MTERLIQRFLRDFTIWFPDTEEADVSVAFALFTADAFATLMAVIPNTLSPGEVAL